MSDAKSLMFAVCYIFLKNKVPLKSNNIFCFIYH